MRRYPIHDDFKRYERLVPPITRQTLPLLRAAQHLLPLPSPQKRNVLLLHFPSKESDRIWPWMWFLSYLPAE